jgi:uncharacterized protein YhhL (DUF1145 family)
VAQETPEILVVRVTPAVAAGVAGVAIQIFSARATGLNLVPALMVALALVVGVAVVALVLLARLALLVMQEPQGTREPQALHQQGLDRLYRVALRGMVEMAELGEPAVAVAVAGRILTLIRLFRLVTEQTFPLPLGLVGRAAEGVAGV